MIDSISERRNGMDIHSCGYMDMDMVGKMGYSNGFRPHCFGIRSKVGSTIF